MATRESPMDVYNNMWCDECDKEVEPNERAYHCRSCEDFDICENCHLHGSKHVDPSHTFQLVTFKGAPSDANMMSDPRDCSKCDRKMEKGELFYHSKEDDDYDLCIDCYDKKISKRKISEEDFQLMVYCLPSEGALIVENRRCGQCRQKIPRPDMFYVDKSNPQYDLCQSCFVKGGYQGNMFQLVAYEPGHTDDEDESEEDTETNAPNIPSPTAGAGQTQQGAWVMPSGPPMYSDLGNQGGTEPNSNQGWTLPTAPPSYSDVPVQGIGAATAPPIVPDMNNLSLNPGPDLPPPTYDDAMRDKASLAIGDIIIFSSSESTVKQTFESSGYKWDDQMKGMLGKQFPVLDILEGNVIALPSPDGSQDGKWYFPMSVLQKVPDASQ